MRAESRRGRRWRVPSVTRDDRRRLCGPAVDGGTRGSCASRMLTGFERLAWLEGKPAFDEEETGHAVRRAAAATADLAGVREILAVARQRFSYSFRIAMSSAAVAAIEDQRLDVLTEVVAAVGEWRNLRGPMSDRLRADRALMRHPDMLAGAIERWLEPSGYLYSYSGHLLACVDGPRALECVHVLLAEGAKLNDTVTTGYSALHYAVQSGAVNSTSVLLAAGADPHLRFEACGPEEFGPFVDGSVHWTREIEPLENGEAVMAVLDAALAANDHAARWAVTVRHVAWRRRHMAVIAWWSWHDRVPSWLPYTRS